MPMPKKDRTGFKKIMNCGMECECIAYKTHKDCDFKFTDGTVLKHRYWKQFKDGTLIPSNLKKKMFEQLSVLNKQESKYLGKIYQTDYGMTYKVIDYVDNTKVTVEFSNGIKHTVAAQRLNERLTYPGITLYRNKANGTRTLIEIGMKFKQSNNEELEIISNIDKGGRILVKKSDGDEIKVFPKDLIEGKVFDKSYKDFYKFHGIKCKKAFKNNNITYYTIYKNNQEIALMTLQEIYKMKEEQIENDN